MPKDTKGYNLQNVITIMQAERNMKFHYKHQQTDYKCFPT